MEECFLQNEPILIWVAKTQVAVVARAFLGVARLKVKCSLY